mmetsp:Transcript_48360/g.113191  ORF Transcript_48360/g.113191 Transcript_48360/m.113191 type:complete len:200 (+) Transcript_48360:119-718(+)
MLQTEARATCSAQSFANFLPQSVSRACPTVTPKGIRLHGHHASRPYCLVCDDRHCAAKHCEAHTQHRQESKRHKFLLRSIASQRLVQFLLAGFELLEEHSNQHKAKYAHDTAAVECIHLDCRVDNGDQNQTHNCACNQRGFALRLNESHDATNQHQTGIQDAVSNQSGVQVGPCRGLRHGQARKPLKEKRSCTGWLEPT